MRRYLLPLLAATALTSPVLAADDPPLLPGANDTRIRSIDYSERKVTRITSTDMVPVTITYGETEIPTLIAGVKVVSITPKDGADAKTAAEAAESCTDWCADRHANELTLQPLKPDAGSMLAVTTQKTEDGKTIRHHYAYELRTRTGTIAETIADGRVTEPADKEAYFRVYYTYSAEDAAAKATAWRQTHATDIAAAEHAKVLDHLATSSYSAPRNYNWKFNDSPDCSTLGPERISDDGQLTVIHFRMNAPVSIPNIVGDDDKESLASFHTDKAPDSGLVMVVHGVPGRRDPRLPAMVLRRDKMVCGLYNWGFNPNATAPNTGTSAPDVVRDTKR
jgi:type IV secretory pathway VirB9-like protein